jgi:MFS family permease
VEEPPPESSDRRRLSILVVGFGTALGVTAFTYPLLALESGLSATAVGLLASVSAALQMASRLVLPYLLSRFLDRSLMVFALLVMAVSAGALLVTQALIGFVVAQVGQGFARGVFHTASQTHAVRNPGVASRGLAFVQTTAQFGRLIGGGRVAGRDLVARLAHRGGGAGWRRCPVCSDPRGHAAVPA